MSAAAEAGAADGAAPAKGGGKKKLMMIGGLVVVLGGAGGGLWFTGILPKLLGHGKPEHVEEAKPAVPTFFDLPEIIANLDAGPRRTSFVKTKVKLQLAKPDDAALATQALPKLQDLLQTYLREMRPEELRGGVGIYRLREELLARASLALPPGTVQDVLFTEMIVQ